MSQQFEALVHRTMLEGDETIRVDIVAGSIAFPRSAECEITLRMPREEAQLYPAGAKVFVTLESEHEPEYEPVE